MTDLTRVSWRKSSFSNGGTNGQCVELGNVGDGLAVRDSKNPEGGALIVGPTGRAAFLRAVREGRLGR